MSNTFPNIHRDISWLGFNERVLQEAKDPNVPLIERVKFLAIYSSNLNEFFRVRVANHRSLFRSGKKNQRSLQYDPEDLLKQIQKIVNEQQIEFSRIFEEEIDPQLKSQGIYLLRREELSETQKEFIATFFQDHILPFIQPALLVKHKIKPFLNNAALYLTIHLKEKDQQDKEKYAIVQIPSDKLPRFIELPSEISKRHDLIMLDDVIRHSVSWMFPGYDIIDTYSIKLTRDAELYIDDEFSGDLIEKIRKGLQKRNVGPASRLVYDKEMPAKLLKYLQEVLDVQDLDLLPEGRYHNNFDFFQFPDYGMTHLKNTPLPPLPYHPLEDTDSFFETIAKKDHLIHVPYHSYESVIRFFEEAADDPLVTHIKIVQYRVAQDSRIMEALQRAVKAGKQVFAFIEVKARFDEEANLIWGERLEKAGVLVKYSFPGLKVHSKAALIRRVEPNGSKLYAYMSTGNFHENTSKIYSDFGFFTADMRIVTEVARVFSHLETGHTKEDHFDHLLVGQFNLRTALEDLIHTEMENAKNGKESGIMLKMNSIQDVQMIQLLYEASQCGVPIQMIVRGICSIVPGVEGVSENIDAISIVDRYLEHSRVFIFKNEGKPKVFLSSADWMTRNLSHRIETIFPIYDEDLQKHIMDFIGTQLHDNAKARSLNFGKINTYRTDTSEMPIRSQHETYFYIKRLNDDYMRKLEEEKEKQKAMEEENGLAKIAAQKAPKAFEANTVTEKIEDSKGNGFWKRMTQLFQKN
jgi:polyphosphate kinase